MRATPDRWSCHSDDDLPQLGLSGRPQVGSDEPREVGRVGVGDRVALGADVDLLAPVDLALGALAADARVAAEVRALDVLDRELVGLGQREEVAGGAVQPRLELGRDAGAGQIEEPDVVGRVPQVVAEPRGGVGSGVELGEIEDRQVEVGHAVTIGGCRGIPPECCRPDYLARGYAARLDSAAIAR